MLVDVPEALFDAPFLPQAHPVVLTSEVFDVGSLDRFAEGEIAQRTDLHPHLRPRGELVCNLLQRPIFDRLADPVQVGQSRRQGFALGVVEW